MSYGSQSWNKRKTLASRNKLKMVVLIKKYIPIKVKVIKNMILYKKKLFMEML